MNTEYIISDAIGAAKRALLLLKGEVHTVELVAEAHAMKSGDKEWFEFKFAGHTYKSETNEFREVRQFCSQIEKALKELKAKGYKVAPHRDTYYEQVYDYVWHSHRSEPVEVTNGIIIYGDPSKEFKSLAKWIEKFTGLKLDIFTLYSVSIFGKRGHFDSETGSRQYLCYKGDRCRRILDWIIKNKSSRDTLTAEVKTIDDCDEEELRYSRYAETECYGARRSFLHLEVKTPTGRVKAAQDSYLI